MRDIYNIGGKTSREKKKLAADVIFLLDKKCCLKVKSKANKQVNKRRARAQGKHLPFAANTYYNCQDRQLKEGTK